MEILQSNNSIPHSELCIVYIVYHILYSVKITLYSVEITLYNVEIPLYIMHSVIIHCIV